MKSQCTKAHCKTAAGIDGRPAMIVCARDVKKKRQKKTVKGLDTPAKKSKYQEIYEDSDSDSSLLSVNELSDDETTHVNSYLSFGKVYRCLFPKTISKESGFVRSTKTGAESLYTLVEL